ncbi:MAG: leucine-rich repeat domain-containing protein [Promethearchaeota archaeon]
MGKLKSLATLDLVGNKLKTIPETIGNLQNLEQLFLSENELAKLPKSLDNCKAYIIR